MIIKEHSRFEHVKTLPDKIQDIYEHTDAKIGEVMRQAATEYNKIGTNKIDPHSAKTLQNVLKNSFA